MPWVDDVLNGLEIQLDKLWYDVLRLLAVAGWALQKGLFLMGHAIQLINLWLVDNAFAPLIAQTNSQLRVTAGLSFVIALFVLGITYLLAAFVRLDVVRPRSAIAWYLAGAVFFQLGPSLYQGMNTFRQDLSTGFYGIALDSMQGAGSPFSSLGAVSSDDQPPLAACDALGPYLPNAAGFSHDIDGLDIALAYLRADGQDVMGYPAPALTSCFQPHPPGQATDLPSDWIFRDTGYFYSLYGSQFFGDPLGEEERKESLDRAGQAQFRIFSAWPLIIFGVIEQLIFLLLTIAQGLTFVSFSIAILFSFFKKTEVIARSILDMWIELIIQTIAIALIQSLIISFLLGAAATQNALVVLGVSLICAIFILVLLWSGVKAVWNSFNRLFGAIGQATGGVMVAPGAVGLGLAGAGVAAGVGTAAIAANVGSSALAGLSATQQGATTAQTAGVMLGGSRRLSSAARTLAYLPGLRGTPLGEAAGEFTEGAMVRQVGQSLPIVGGIAGPVIGAQLLSDRREGPKRKRSMSLPAEPLDETSVTEPGTVRPIRTPRMGTFTPLDETPPPPAVIRPPATAGQPGGWSGTAVDRARYAVGEQGEEIEDRVSAVGADVRAQAGQSRADRERSDYADDMHGEEVEDRITSLGATLRTGQQAAGGDTSALDRAAGRLASAADTLARSGGSQPTLGLMRVDGAHNVAGVMGDFVSQARVERALAGQPMTDGVDHFTVAQGVARVMGVTPQPGDHAPVQGDISRLGLFGDQALRLGLNGVQAAQVIREVKLTPEGTLQPQTRTALVNQARATLHTGWDGAQQAVSALQRAAAMLPDTITARGTVAVPNVNVTPQVQVNVNTPERGGLDEALQSQAALAGKSIGGGEKQ
jgi:hypothetical protein